MKAGALSEIQRRNVARATRLTEINDRSGLEAVERVFDEFFHPDFEWRPGLSGLGAEVYRGRDGYRKFIADMNAIATDSTVSDHEIEPVGDTHILALGHMHFVGRESGVTLDSEYGALYEVEDGRARSARGFLSHAEARRAAAEVEGGTDA